MKKIISTISAGALVVALAGSVLAADYAKDPGYSAPAATATPQSDITAVAKNDITVSSTTGMYSVADLPKVNVVTAATINAVIANEVPVAMQSKNTVLKASAFKALATSSGKIEIVTTTHSIQIKGNDIEKAKVFDLSMKVKSDSKSVVLSTKAKGEFGYSATVTVDVSKMSKAALANAKVYVKVNGKVTEVGPVVLDKNGNAVITMDQGGEYIIAANAPK